MQTYIKAYSCSRSFSLNQLMLLLQKYVFLLVAVQLAEYLVGYLYDNRLVIVVILVMYTYNYY
jgi:hypothetical protein